MATSPTLDPNIIALLSKSQVLAEEQMKAARQVIANMQGPTYIPQPGEVVAVAQVIATNLVAVAYKSGNR